METRELYLQYDFTEEELKRLSNKLAYAAQEAERVREQKKSVMADFKSQLDNLEMTIGSTSQKVTNGYEMRHVECQITYNKPYDGMKEIKRLDTGKIWSEQMDRNDWNLFNQSRPKPDKDEEAND